MESQATARDDSRTTSIHYEEAKPLIGARVQATRADMADPDFVRECLNLLDERIVLVFPEIGLSEAEQLTFTDLLGERYNFVKQLVAEENSDIYKITLDPNLNTSPEYVLGTFFWHMDGVMEEFPPSKASLLSCIRPSAKGGQTEFSNLFAAYEHLPEEEKAALEGLTVLHSVYSAVRPVLELDVTPESFQGIKKQQEHPLVWNHANGRKSLLVGTHADRVTQLSLAEGRALLLRLLEWAGQREFTYRHDWSQGDFVVWNNCGSLHRVVPYDRNSGRMMHRTSVAGNDPIQ
ncbi:TauD/TfdA dioxygenase family protein [Haliea sp. E17]|uniref:TauD/TfdA dioxygenase family protein n=1 Tax=Haliea sp. E17 TaxID=3401576 RepID=UPI003AAD619D